MANIRETLIAGLVATYEVLSADFETCLPGYNGFMGSNSPTREYGIKKLANTLKDDIDYLEDKRDHEILELLASVHRTLSKYGFLLVSDGTSLTLVDVDRTHFELWMRRLNDVYETFLGLGIDDLPDRNYWAAFEVGYNPTDYFQENKDDIIAGN